MRKFELILLHFLPSVHFWPFSRCILCLRLIKLNKNQLVANEKSDERDEWENEKILAQKYFEQNAKMKAKVRKILSWNMLTGRHPPELMQRVCVEILTHDLKLVWNATVTMNLFCVNLFSYSWCMQKPNTPIDKAGERERDVHDYLGFLEAIWRLSLKRKKSKGSWERERERLRQLNMGSAN